jgi:hypothetical protein
MASDICQAAPLVREDDSQRQNLRIIHHLNAVMSPGWYCTLRHTGLLFASSNMTVI